MLTFAFIQTVIALGALSFGRGFLWYSIGTALVILVAGAIVGVQSAGLAEGDATPWMGFIERISSYGMMAYVAAVALRLWGRADKQEIKVEPARELSGVA